MLKRFIFVLQYYGLFVDEANKIYECSDFDDGIGRLSFPSPSFITFYEEKTDDAIKHSLVTPCFGLFFRTLFPNLRSVF